MLTDDEAKDKWCPFARTTMYIRGDMPDADAPINMIGHAANRMVTDDPGINAKIEAALAGSGATRCIGSKCMAWHGETELVYRDSGKRVSPGSAYVKDSVEYKRLGRGYCGLVWRHK